MITLIACLQHDRAGGEVIPQVSQPPPSDGNSAGPGVSKKARHEAGLIFMEGLSRSKAGAKLDSPVSRFVHERAQVEEID